MDNERSVNIDSQVGQLNELLVEALPEEAEAYRAMMDQALIYHDSALEGTMYTPPELTAALTQGVASDSTLIPAYDEIRQHKSALDFIRDFADKKKGAITIDTIKHMHELLAPDDTDGKTNPYRKDMPLHRLYFHEISTPDKIMQRMRQLADWLNDPETRRGAHPVRIAAKAHFALLQTYPFPKFSGKVARLLMNMLLLRAGYPAAILHYTERQRYYEAMKTGANALSGVINDALTISVESGIRFLETQPSIAKKRAEAAAKAAKAAGRKRRSSARPSR